MADEEDSKGRFRSFGSALGGWARRVGDLVAEVSGRPTIPEPLREPLATIRDLRLRGELDEATALTRALLREHPDSPHVRFHLGLCCIHDLIRGGRPLKALREAMDGVGDELGRGAQQFLQGADELYAGRRDRALDHLRRAASQLRLPKADELEARFLLHVLSASAHDHLGFEDRALRELQKARARTPDDAGPALRHLLFDRGVNWMLAGGLVADAESWSRQLLADDEGDAIARAALARVLAARGDRIGAHAMLEKLPDDDVETRIWVGLTVGLPQIDRSEDLCSVALRHLQAAPQDAGRRRLWALAELARPTGPSDADAVLEGLLAASEAAPAATRDRFLQEVAFAALVLDRPAPAVLAAARQRLDQDAGTAPEELRLLRARHRVAVGHEARDEDFAAGPPPRFRADPELGGPWGPDPQSPLRNPDRRGAVLSSQRLLAAAEFALAADQREMAADLLVQALVQSPDLETARVRLGEISRPTFGGRLEELLTEATRLLAAVPNRILGVSLSGVQDAMSQVVAARERLARPLTIAIMGEFSSGKSTFVNALVAEPVAPMGVLPTTSTINVFRRGPGGGARVHYRDGRISTVAPDEVHDFLHGLDTTAAAEVRHVEIERTGVAMGHAAVVDTPGLNALDAFHEQVAREFLDEADAVVWLFSATRSGAASEAGMLAELRAGGRQVLGILNKVDTLDESEQAELAAYLREQLGEVLVEVIPLCARAALEYRTGDEPSGSDPFAVVERALETHFLARARELKRTLTVRRLQEALAGARDSVSTGIEALEARAATVGEARDDGSHAAHLRGFAEDVHEGLLGLDDLLTREALAVGVVVSGEGLSDDLDPQDARYLEACFRDGCEAVLRRTLSRVTHQDAHVGEVLDRAFAPWAQGHLEGLVAAGFVAAALEQHGPTIEQGESAMNAALRLSLVPLAQAWRGRALDLLPEVDRVVTSARRRATSAPAAEALRLRCAVLSGIEALLRSAAEVDA